MSPRSRYRWPPDLAAVVDSLRETGWDVEVSHHGPGWDRRRGGHRLVQLQARLGEAQAPSGVVSAVWSAQPGEELARESFDAYVGPPFGNPVLAEMSPNAVLEATRRLAEQRR